MSSMSRQAARAETAIPVLVYHSISEVPAAGQEAFTVRPARFAEHVAAIADSGRVPLTITGLGMALRGERALPAKAVAITFDDGFDDTLAAVEMLAAANVASTVFVTTDRIGRVDGVAPSVIEGLIALDAEIGAHTVSHPYLDELGPGQARTEIAGSKRVLEDRFQHPVASFAYPHGAYDRGVRQAVVDAGFSVAAAVKNALSHPADDPFAIARWTVMGD